MGSLYYKFRVSTLKEIQDGTANLVLSMILDHAEMNNTNKPQLNQNHIAEELGFEIRKVYKAIKKLEELDYFKHKKISIIINGAIKTSTQFELSAKAIENIKCKSANKENENEPSNENEKSTIIENHAQTNESAINEEIDANSDFNLKEESQYKIEAETKQIETATIKPSMEIENHINMSEILDDDLTFNLDLDIEPKEAEQTQEEQAPIIEDLPYNESNKIDIAKIQNTMVNYYENARDNNNGKTKQLLKAVVSKYPSIQYLRGNLHQWSKEMKQQYKAANIPLVSVSVLFNEQDKQRTKSNIKDYTNIIAIDIDKQDNETDMEIIRNRVCNMPFVFYCSKSVSGEGLFALVYLDGNLEDFEAHYLSLEDYFRNKGIIIDKQCKDATRLRYCTQDDEFYINPKACIYSGLKYKTLPNEIKNNKNFNTKQTFSQLHTIYNCENDIENGQNMAESEEEKKLKKVLKWCKESNIIINPSHKETLLISKALSNDLGLHGFYYLKEFAAIKHGENLDCAKYETLYFNDLKTNTNLHIPTIFQLFKDAKGMEKIDWNLE